MKYAGKKLTVEQESRVIALLARGELYDDIRTHVKEHFGRTISKASIVSVKKRNKENLAIIRDKLLQKEEEDALALKDKANKYLNKRLDREIKTSQIIDDAQKAYLNGEITVEEYVGIVRSHKEITVTEVVNVSKTMHEQSKNTETVENTKTDTAALVEAIRSGDEVTISQLVFNKPKS
jgi:hypothetical protein